MSGDENQYTVVKVHSLTNTNEAGALLFDVVMTDPIGVTERHDRHIFRASDPYGASPALWKWLIDNPGFPITPYVPPTTEET